jgi:hypothetical protein
VWTNCHRGKGVGYADCETLRSRKLFGSIFQESFAIDSGMQKNDFQANGKHSHENRKRKILRSNEGGREAESQTLTGRR